MSTSGKRTAPSTSQSVSQVGVAPRLHEPNKVHAAKAVGSFLSALGMDVGHPELKSTGTRVAQAYVDDLLSGYNEDPAAILANAAQISAKSKKQKVVQQEIVMLTGIPITTMCPHHLLPALGVGHVGYIPSDCWVGLGELARLLDCFSRRLTLQEAIGEQVVEALVRYLNVKAAGCVIDMAPACVICRGARRSTVRSVTSHFAGEEGKENDFRSTFFNAVKTSTQTRVY